ncbi:MAG: DNA polymerase IV, partial [Deltaproteobacteria bacterium]
GAVRRELELPVSVGVAPNKFLAKLCSEEAKPDGVHELKQEAVQSYLAALPLERIWGLGPKGVAKLKALGCRTVAQAQKLSCNQLRSLFGIQGERLYDLLRGRDDRPVVGDRERKSIGAEETFARDLIGQEELEGQLWRLAEQVCRRARRLGLGGTVGTLKVRRADRSVRTRSHTFPEPVDRAEPLVRWAKAQLAGLHQGMPVRLLGLYLAGLAPANQMELFDETERYRRLNQARDRLCNRYGDAILTRASLIGLSGSVQRGTHGLEDGD